MLFLRLAVTLTAAAAALGAAPSAVADDGTGHLDHLTVTVAHSGRAGFDGTHHLYCHPAGGDHPDPKGACAGLDELTVWGKDPFASVQPGTRCTLQYGGPARAHIRGSWAGRPVDTDVSRANGCEMHRWDTLVPLLPRTSLSGSRQRGPQPTARRYGPVGP